MNDAEKKVEKKTSKHKFFNKQDKEEQRLIDQYYIKLKTDYQQIEQYRESKTTENENPKKNKQISEKIETFLNIEDREDIDFPEKTWRNAYYTEQLIALILPEQKIGLEFSRRLQDAKYALSKNMYTYYATQAKDEKIDMRSLFIDLISELQWHKEKQQVERSYGRTARVRTTIIFVIAFLFFFLPNIFPAFSDLLLGKMSGGNPSRIYFVFTAITAGSLGAAFSLLISIRKRLEESNLDGVKVLKRVSYIGSRVVIGMGAGLILYYFLQSGLIAGALLPKPFSGSVLSASNVTTESTEATKNLTDSDVESSESVKESDGITQALSDSGTEPQYKDLALVIVFCFLSGFSETLIPNLLSETEKQVNTVN
ncbi:MAG: hypothetical protein ETSY2_25375 [Candidatus Entotheonella gemina]|uniref:Uncharacterized protein n=1 Tax=Candidatus Entotheonella gemina TaxID=1429439 RepID=W4M510_9BACT|nr:MAG: hypothetical protein ETSY2_25375 [Candidatus Entotheonella gemina]